MELELEHERHCLILFRVSTNCWFLVICSSYDHSFCTSTSLQSSSFFSFSIHRGFFRYIVVHMHEERTTKTKKKRGGLFQLRSPKSGNVFRGLKCHFQDNGAGFCQNLLKFFRFKLIQWVKFKAASHKILV